MADTGCTACPTAAPPLPDTRPLPALPKALISPARPLDAGFALSKAVPTPLAECNSPRSFSRSSHPVESDTYLILSCHAWILLGSLEFMGVTFLYAFSTKWAENG